MYLLLFTLTDYSMLPLRKLFTSFATLLSFSWAVAQSPCQLNIPFNSAVCLLDPYRPIFKYYQNQFFGTDLLKGFQVGDYKICPLTKTVLELSGQGGDFTNSTLIAQGNTLTEALANLTWTIFQVPPRLLNSFT